MTADFDTISAALQLHIRGAASLNDWKMASDALARVQAAAEQAVEALANLVEHIDANGGCHRGCPEHDDARAALAALRDKDTR